MNQNQTQSSKMNKKPLYVIIDNGHGTREYTKGKCAPDKSLYEGEWNRDFAKKLGNMFAASNIEYQYLVLENQDIGLRERVNRANKIYYEKCKQYEVILISVHINAAGNEGKWHDARGFTVWVSTNAGDKSKTLGKLIGQEATTAGLRGNRYIPKEQYHTRGFTIIHDTKMPAILCEHLFMDNKEDLAMLKDPEQCNKLLDIYKYVFKRWDKEGF